MSTEDKYLLVWVVKEQQGLDLAKMREAIRAAEKRELEALAERDEARANVETLKTHVETLREAWQGASEAAVKLGDKLDQAERELDEAKAAIRLVLEADCLKSHAFERGDDDASVYDLLKSVVGKP